MEYGYPRHPEIHSHFLTLFRVLASGPPSAKLCPLAQFSNDATAYSNGY